MNNKRIFIYTTPHPAHAALARAIDCEFIQTHRDGIAKTPYLGRQIAASRAIKSINPADIELILTESISTDLVAGAALKLKNPKIKLVALLTDPKLFELNNAPIFDKIKTLSSLKEADLLLVGSKMMYDYVPFQYKSKTKIFTPGIENIEKHLLKTAKFNNNIVFVGTLNKYKSANKVFDIFIKYRFDKLNVDSELYVAGSGEFESWFKNKRHMGIHYYGQTRDSLFMSNVAAFYVAPAIFEPSGVAIIEAMAQGIVPIVSSGVGYKDVVAKISKKLIVNNINDYVTILTHLNKNPEIWRVYSVKAKKIAADFTYKNMIKQFKSILKRNKIL